MFVLCAAGLDLWRASHQQVYKELARLKEEGRVSVKVVAQRSRPDKKVYAITKLNEIRRYLASGELPD